MGSYWDCFLSHLKTLGFQGTSVYIIVTSMAAYCIDFGMYGMLEISSMQDEQVVDDVCLLRGMSSGS